MLNDDERRCLADLEYQLRSDPAFAARMAGPVTTRPEPASPAVPILCALLFILVPLVMLLFGWPGVLIVLDLFAAAVAVILLRRRTR